MALNDEMEKVEQHTMTTHGGSKRVSCLFLYTYIYLRSTRAHPLSNHTQIALTCRLGKLMAALTASDGDQPHLLSRAASLRLHACHGQSQASVHATSWRTDGLAPCHYRKALWQGPRLVESSLAGVCLMSNICLKSAFLCIAANIRPDLFA